MYKIDQVESLFNCELCSKTYVEPVTLPCGSTVCLFHTLGQDSFKCNLCSEEHNVPKNGFRVNKNLQNALDLQINKAFKANPVIQECRKHIENANTIIYKMKSLVNSSEDYIYEYFEEIKRQVDLRRERLKKEVDDCSDRAIAQVEKTKSDCMKISVSIQEKEKEIEELEKGLQRLKNEFDTLEVNEARFTGVKKELVFYECKLDEMLIAYQDEVRGNKEYLFEYGKAMSDDFFGGFKTEKISQKGMLFCKNKYYKF